MAKLYAGGQIHMLRTSRGLTQVEMAQLIDISPSYLNQLENDQRPVTAPVLLKLTSTFGVDAAYFSGEAEREQVAELADLLPAIPESELADFALRFPTIAAAVRAIPATLSGAAPDPYEGARNYFQANRNYFHDIDTTAEALAARLAGRQLRLTRLAAAFDRDLGYTVRFNQHVEGPRSELDQLGREVRLRAGLTEAQQCFELSYHYGRLSYASMFAERVAAIDDAATRRLTEHGLGQYFAAAVTMPYAEILAAARETRYDVDVISARFGTGFESTCQRLGTLQRPGAEGVPFVFIRTDRSGTISKRQATAPFHFSRDGGSCPLWVVHRAFETPNRVTRQVSVTPDGRTQMWVARMVQGPAVGFGAPRREHAVALGCDAAHASQLVYADGLDLNPAAATPIGPGCDTCPRARCPQRAFPHARVEG
ncbi:MerR family transcriptional regulator [Corynebacterium sp. BCW_4722]|nr:MerR family transcriptional regulator [Corynebacterium sp. BCW_4722]